LIHTAYLSIKGENATGYVDWDKNFLILRLVNSVVNIDPKNVNPVIAANDHIFTDS